MTEDLPVFANEDLGPDEAQRGYSIAKYMGASFVRSHLGRDTVFTWGPTNRVVNNALARGLQPYLTLTYRRRHRKPDDPSYVDQTFMGVPTVGEFRTWCAEAADEFDGRVQHFSVWNEPNYFGDGMTPALYNQLFRACSEELKAEIPNAKVYYGEIAADGGDPCAWVTNSLVSGDPTIADGLAIHTYQWTTPPTQQVTGLCLGIGRLGDWNSLRNFWLSSTKSLRTLSNAAVPLLVTEHGYCDSHGECPPSAGSSNSLPEATRAQYAAQAFDFAEANGVQIFSYYHLYNQPDAPTTPGRWDTGIVERDGGWTPSVSAIRSATGATAPYEDPFKFRTYAFADVSGDGKADAIKANQGVPTTVRLSTGNGFGPAQNWTDIAFVGDRGSFFADASGDGKADALVSNQWTPIVLRRSTGALFTPNESWTSGPYIGDRGNYFADVTGDGKADAMVVNDWTPIIVRRSTGSAFNPNESWTTNTYLGDRGNYFADVTGDGKADAIVVNQWTPVIVRRSTGTAFNPNETWTDVPYLGNRGNYFADVTGDGKDDAIVVNDWTPIVVKRSNGSGFGPNEGWTAGPF